MIIVQDLARFRQRASRPVARSAKPRRRSPALPEGPAQSLHLFNIRSWERMERSLADGFQFRFRFAYGLPHPGFAQYTANPF